MPVQVGTRSRDAVQQTFIGGCSVYLATGPRSRVDVLYVGAGSLCDKAKALADVVEPKLPPQQR